MQDTEIGYVFTTASGRWRRYPIRSCGSYGVTCGGLFTCNGSARLLSGWLAAMISNAVYTARDVPDYTVQVFVQEQRCQTEEEIFAAVTAAHRALTV